MSCDYGHGKKQENKSSDSIWALIKNQQQKCTTKIYLCIDIKDLLRILFIYRYKNRKVRKEGRRLILHNVHQINRVHINNLRLHY